MKTDNVTAPAVGCSVLLASLKQASGISCANCSTCVYLGTDSDGNYPEYAVSWDVCEKFEGYKNLKSFPFKKEMPCWEPEFWHSKFTEEIKSGEHEEVMELVGKFSDAVKAAYEANAGTQRPGSPDGSLATETRKPGSLK